MAALTKADMNYSVTVTAAEASAEAQRLQGEGIAKQRAEIVQGLQDSIGDGEALDASRVSELLLITQYFDALEKISEQSGVTLFMPHGVGSVASTSEQINDGVLGKSTGIRGGDARAIAPTTAAARTRGLRAADGSDGSGSMRVVAPRCLTLYPARAPLSARRGREH